MKMQAPSMSDKTSTLEFVWQQHVGGNGATARQYIDFVVDGQSLKVMLRSAQIGCLGWGAAESQKESAAKLLLKSEPELPNGRHLLYVCPECGDIGCGAITVTIEKTAEHFVWKDFGYENNYYDGMPLLENYRQIGPFFFDSNQYSQLLEDYLKSLQS